LFRIMAGPLRLLPFPPIERPVASPDPHP
jgi:hypothetical protein